MHTETTLHYFLPPYLPSNNEYHAINKTHFARNEPPAVFYSFLRSISFLINPSSRPVCPDMELFSCALRIKYGTTSLRGPKGRYLLTEQPARARLKVMLSLIPYSCEK